MPHKRAKRSVRQQASVQQGRDLAPSQHALSTEAIPKGAARVLNAWKVQQDYREKKRTLEDGAQEDGSNRPKKRRRQGTDGETTKSSKGAQPMQIQPGESLAHFNRRVEESMRPLVRDAMKTSAAIERKAKKEEGAAREAVKAKAQAVSAKRKSEESKNAEPSTKAAGHPPPRGQRAESSHSPKDFASFSTSAPRSVNDIVQAPPELKKLPRGVKRSQASKVAPTGSGSSSLREGALSMAQKVMLEEERERVVKAYRELKKRMAAGG